MLIYYTDLSNKYKVLQFVDDSVPWLMSGSKQLAVKKMQLLLNEVDKWSNTIVINTIKASNLY
jgi:hypothetical protein